VAKPDDPCEVFPCPVCGSEMELAYDRDNIKVCVCADCLTSLSVPSEAWRALQQRLAEKKKS